jgi:hypothetical protein
MPTTARRQRRKTNDLEMDAIGVEALEMTDEYLARLDALTKNLSQVVPRRDCAKLVAGYVQYAQEVCAVSDLSAPVGLAEWLRALEEES